MLLLLVWWCFFSLFCLAWLDWLFVCLIFRHLSVCDGCSQILCRGTVAATAVNHNHLGAGKLRAEQSGRPGREGLSKLICRLPESLSTQATAPVRACRSAPAGAVRQASAKPRPPSSLHGRLHILDIKAERLPSADERTAPPPTGHQKDPDVHVARLWRCCRVRY